MVFHDLDWQERGILIAGQLNQQTEPLAGDYTPPVEKSARVQR
jgi:hypothetical protein